MIFTTAISNLSSVFKNDCHLLLLGLYFIQLYFCFYCIFRHFKCFFFSEVGIYCGNYRKNERKCVKIVIQIFNVAK